MHRKSKHQVRVHDFASAAKAIQERQVERSRAGLSWGRCVAVLVITLASATLYAVLSRVAIEQQMLKPLIGDMPWWTVSVVANVAGFLTGMAAIGLLRPKTVANKQQKSPQKAA